MAVIYKDMTCKITIGTVVFNVVHSVNVKQSINEFADTAKIILPREFSEVIKDGAKKSLQRKNIREFIKEGDAITIELGYDGYNLNVFNGYLTDIGADIPLALTCEDEMWQLRKEKFNNTYKQVNLLDLLKDIAPGYEYDVIDDIPLGKFIVANSTAYEVLEALRKDYLLFSRFENKKLIVGFASDVVPNKVHEINLNRNVKNKSDLKFVRKDKIKLLIKAVSNNSDGSKMVVEVGEKGGDTRTLNFANKTKTELENLAQKNLDSLHFDGYRGVLKTFGEPSIKSGEAVNITDNNYSNSEREGKYLIESNEITFEKSTGYSQALKLSLKL